jgi:RNA polymerase primary sigma factor
LEKEGVPLENLEKAIFIIFDNKISLVKKKSDYQSKKKKESEQGETEKVSDKSDDPIRMYLHEMGDVELLSREGEIAIANELKQGKDVMINAITQSPLVAKAIFQWKDELEKNQLMIRDIIDIDSTYEDFENNEEEDVDKKIKKDKKDNKLKKTDNVTQGEKKGTEEYVNLEDEFNVSLAAMEEEIKPKVMQLVANLSKNYTKLKKYQIEKLNCILNAKELSVSKSKNLKKIQSTLVNDFKNLQLSSSIIEELVQDHYKENKKILSLEGVLLRLINANNISREEFIKFYVGNEINPKFDSFLKGNKTWRIFFNKNQKEFDDIRERLVEFSKKIELSSW